MEKLLPAIEYTWVNAVRQSNAYSRTTSALEVELAIEKLSHKSPGIDQIPAELRQGVEQYAKRSINLLLFGIRNCLTSWGRLLYISIRRAIKHCNYR